MDGMEKNEQNITMDEELADFSHWLSIAKDKKWVMNYTLI